MARRGSRRQLGVPVPYRVRELPAILPVTVLAQIDSTHYRVFWKGGYYELFTASSANLTVGQLVFARRIGRGQLFLPWVSSTSKCAIFGQDLNGYPTVIYTTDIGAAVPTWVENKSGLPASYYGTADLYSTIRVDPSDFSRAWVLYLASATTFDLYRNTAMTAAGAWASIYDEAQWLIDSGHPSGVVLRVVASIDVCPSDPDTIGILISGAITDGGPFNYFKVVSWVHSHDGGNTWTCTDYLDYAAGSAGGGDWALVGWSVKFGPNTTTRLYIGATGFEPTLTTKYLFWKSDDHGHTISGQQIETVDYTTLYYPIVPALTNPSDDIVSIQGSNNHWWRSADGGANLTSKYDGSGAFDFYDGRYSAPSDDADYLFGPASATFAYSLSYSADQGLTWTEDTDALNDFLNGFAKTSTKMVKAGLDSTWNQTVVYYGAPGNWSDKTGNIDLAITDAPLYWVLDVALT